MKGDDGKCGLKNGPIKLRCNLSTGKVCPACWYKKQAAPMYLHNIRLSDITETIYISI